MTNFLIRKFIKNYDDINDPAVRRSYGMLSSLTGIVCNIFLFVLKYAMSAISGSVSVMSDAFNNLSDCAGCIVTLLGYKMAAKPADRKHPFGHGRMEYLTALFIAVLILIVAFELLKNSAGKIIHPQRTGFSFVVLVALVLSALVKLWMSVFNVKLGRKINSSAILAAAKDSRSDVAVTLSVCISAAFSAFTNFPVDGLIGVAVSLFIMKCGIDIVRDTADSLIGKPADEEIVAAIHKMVSENEKILGIHDLVIHNYGPASMIGSCHAEVRSCESFVEIHNEIDELERRIRRELNIMMTIHMDPVETDNEYVGVLLKMVREIVSGISPGLLVHDFRIVSEDDFTNLIFDILMPYECGHSEEYIRKLVEHELAKKDEKFFCFINFYREH